MSNKQEIAKISREIKSIKAELSKSASVTLTFDNWKAVGPIAQKKMLQKLGDRAKTLLEMMGHDVERVNVRTYLENTGWGSQDMFWSVEVELENNSIDLYPAGQEEEEFSGIAWNFGSNYKEKKFSGSDVENAFENFSKWVLSMLANDVMEDL